MEFSWLIGILKGAWYVVLVALLFGGTIFLHELGHFMSARWLGLKIKAFAIGMGPALWKKRVNGVDYKLCLLPIGGYVALPQMDITGSALQDEEAGDLQPVEPWKRIVVAFAGPLMNIIFAFILAYTVYTIGMPYNPHRAEATLAHVAEDSAAYEAGLRSGDRVIQANDDKVSTWYDLLVVSSLNEQLHITAKRDGETFEVDVATTENELGMLNLEGVTWSDEVLVKQTAEDGAAREAGVLPDDVLFEMAGKKILHSGHFFGMVQENEGAPFVLTVLRGKDRVPVDLTMSPKFKEDFNGKGDDAWLIGIHMKGATVHPAPIEQVKFFSAAIFRTLKAFTNKKEIANAGKSIGGPPMIIRTIWDQVQMPIGSALWFMGLINVNLAIINLLPIIVLDGGHIMVALFEILFRRKPHPAVITAMANVAVVLLLTTMLYLSVRDIFTIRKMDQLVAEAQKEAVATPTPDSGTP